VSVKPVTIKEFQEQEILLNVLDNSTEPIDNVKVASFDTFTVLSGGSVNIPGKTKDGAHQLLSGQEFKPRVSSQY